jgi:hypothetical protein
MTALSGCNQNEIHLSPEFSKWFEIGNPPFSESI